MCMIQLQNYIMNYQKRIDEYYYLSHARRKKMDRKYKPKKLFIKEYDQSVWPKNKEESTDKEESTNKKESNDKKESVDLSEMSLLEDDKEVKEGKGIKILTPNKLLTRLPISLAQIKVQNNLYKLKKEIRQILYLLHQHNKMIKRVSNNLIKSL